MIKNKKPFNKYVNLLLKEITSLNEIGRYKDCIATTKFLAKKIGKSERQTYRYLEFLRAEGLIVCNTSILKKIYFGRKRVKRFKKRSIKIAKNREKYDIIEPDISPPALDSFLSDKDVYEDLSDSIPEPKYSLEYAIIAKEQPTKEELLAGIIAEYKFAEQQKSEIKPEVKSELPKETEFKMSNFIENKLIPPAGFKKEMDSFNQEKEDEDLIARTARIEKYYNEGRAQEKQSKWENDREDLAEKYFRREYDGSYELKSKTFLEKLAEVMVYKYNELRKIFGEELNDPDIILQMAKDAKFKNNEYYLKRIYPAKEQLAYTVKLFDWVPWDANSKEFKMFEKFYKEIKKENNNE